MPSGRKDLVLSTKKQRNKRTSINANTKLLLQRFYKQVSLFNIINILNVYTTERSFYTPGHLTEIFERCFVSYSIVFKIENFIYQY